MTGKNVKDRMGPGGMDADRIREIMGEAPACPRKGRGTSGNDIMRPARKNGPMQPSVYGKEYLHGIAGVQRRSLHIPASWMSASTNPTADTADSTGSALPLETAMRTAYICRRL